jgi:hypothetical protein
MDGRVWAIQILFGALSQSDLSEACRVYADNAGHNLFKLFIVNSTHRPNWLNPLPSGNQFYSCLKANKVWRETYSACLSVQLLSQSCAHSLRAALLRNSKISFMSCLPNSYTGQVQNISLECVTAIIRSFTLRMYCITTQLSRPPRSVSGIASFLLSFLGCIHWL